MDILKLDRQQVAAQSQLGDWDDQDEDAAWFEPHVGVLEEERFKSLTRTILRQWRRLLVHTQLSGRNQGVKIVTNCALSGPKETA